MNYYDPMFYLCSEKMPFTFRVDFTMTDDVNETFLSVAFKKALLRYPYFSVKVIEEDGELLTVKNDLPPVVYKGPYVYSLGSPEVNYHMFAISYEGNVISFFVSHVITDGCGFMPFAKTVLYYYLCNRYNIALDHEGISLAGEPFFEGECENPFPEEKMSIAEPFYRDPEGEYFRLTDGEFVKDHIRTVYSLRIREDETLRFTRGHDGSPSALCSALMSKVIRKLHPDEHRDIVSAISFNYRSALGNRCNYRMLSTALKLRYPDRLRDADITKICTCTRGMISLRMQPENALANAQKLRVLLESLAKYPSVFEKKKILGEIALRDSVDNTFSISYVGKIDFGSLTPYITAYRIFTDGSVNDTIFLEISSVNGWFYINFLQGFSSDVYFRAFLNELSENEIHFEELEKKPLLTAGTVLP